MNRLPLRLVEWLLFGVIWLAVMPLVMVCGVAYWVCSGDWRRG